MKKFILVFIYGLIFFIPCALLAEYFKIGDVWWINILIGGFALFFGSFLYTQFHGTQVMELRHFEAETDFEVSNKFQVMLKVSGLEHLRIIGKYEGIPYPDSVLQAKIFKALNSFPTSKWIREFAKENGNRTLNITIPGMAGVDDSSNVLFTMIELEKYSLMTGLMMQLQKVISSSTLRKMQSEFEGLSEKEIHVKLREWEGSLFDQARKNGHEDSLASTWRTLGLKK